MAKIVLARLEDFLTPEPKLTRIRKWRTSRSKRHNSIILNVWEHLYLNAWRHIGIFCFFFIEYMCFFFSVCEMVFLCGFIKQWSVVNSEVVKPRSNPQSTRAEEMFLYSPYILTISPFIVDFLEKLMRIHCRFWWSLKYFIHSLCWIDMEWDLKFEFESLLIIFRFDLVVNFYFNGNVAFIIHKDSEP